MGRNLKLTKKLEAKFENKKKCKQIPKAYGPF
jgi:hypothetical protein